MFAFLYKLKPLVPFNPRGCRPFCAFYLFFYIRHVKHTEEQKEPNFSDGRAETCHVCNHPGFDENTFSSRRFWRKVECVQRQASRRPSDVDASKCWCLNADSNEARKDKCLQYRNEPCRQEKQLLDKLL